MRITPGAVQTSGPSVPRMVLRWPSRPTNGPSAEMTSRPAACFQDLASEVTEATLKAESGNLIFQPFPPPIDVWLVGDHEDAHELRGRQASTRADDTPYPTAGPSAAVWQSV